MSAKRKTALVAAASAVAGALVAVVAAVVGVSPAVDVAPVEFAPIEVEIPPIQIEVIEKSGAPEQLPPAPLSQISEAYILKGIHVEWARDVAPLLGRLWTNSDLKSIDADSWSNADDRKITLHWECGTPTTLHFRNLGYDPERSRIEYGDTKVIARSQSDLNKHARMYDLRESDDPGKFSETDEVTLTQERSVSTARTVEMDVTVENETKIGGSYAGVSIEDTLKETFGYKQTSEYDEAKTESESKTETFTFDVDLPPRAATAILPQASTIDSSTPFTFVGQHTFGFKIYFGYACNIGNYPSGAWRNWFDKGAGWLSSDHNKKWCRPFSEPELRMSHNGCSIEFGSVDAFLEFLQGRDVEWPGMGIRPKLPDDFGDEQALSSVDENGVSWYETECKKTDACTKAFDQIGDGGMSKRVLMLTGTQKRHYEDVITTKVQRFTDDDDIRNWAADHGVEIHHGAP